MIKDTLLRLRRCFTPAKEIPATKTADGYRHIIGICAAHIVKSLEAFAAADAIAACRNHRKTECALSKARSACRLSPESLVIYIDYVAEATVKVAETTRLIVTRPETEIPLSVTCDMLTARDLFIQISQECIRPGDGRPDACHLQKDIRDGAAFIKRLIRSHSRSMTHADFDDGSFAYTYLTLLYYLHSCLISLEKCTLRLMRPESAPSQ